MATPLIETRRVKLLPAYVGDVRGWKASDAAETIIYGAKNPAVDVDDTSFYALNPRTGTQTYLGTTVLGKDGGFQPFVLNDGTVVLLLTEAPIAGGVGATAELFLVTLQYKLSGEVAGASSTVDAWARGEIAKHEGRLDKIATAAMG
jgi:hypothetical protein